MKFFRFGVVLMVAAGLASTAAAQYGDGSDGPLVVAPSATVTFSAARTTLSLPAVATNTGLTVVDGSGFALGMEVMIVGVHGANAGNWETTTLSGVSGNSLSLASALTKDFDGEAVVVEVPNYSSVSIGAAGVLQVTAPLSVLAFRCNGTTTIDGYVTAIGTGYQANGVAAGGGVPGDSHPGDASGFATDANGGGGGGGGANSAAASSGGGGAYGSAGEAGEQPTGGLGAGAGGAVYGLATLDEMFFGSAGGGMSKICPTVGPCPDPTPEGHGGGIVFIAAPNVDLGGSGVIAADGADGLDGFVGTPDGGNSGEGAGSGGSVYLVTETLVGTAGATIRAVGGSGGQITGGPSSSLGVGGDGGDGRIRVNGIVAPAITITPAPFIVGGTADSDGWMNYN